MPYEYEETEDEFNLRITGMEKDGLFYIRDALELEEAWVVFPLLLDSFYKVLRVNDLSDEKLDIIFTGNREGKAVGVSSVEQMRVWGKMLEMREGKKDV